MAVADAGDAERYGDGRLAEHERLVGAARGQAAGPLPSPAELVERIARHQREMLDWAEGRRTHSPQGWRGELTPAMAEANRQQLVMLAVAVQAELAVLDFVMART